MNKSVMLELMCINDDDYKNLAELMRLVGGSIDVQEYSDISRYYLSLSFDPKKIEKRLNRKVGRKKKIIVQVDQDGNEVLDNNGHHEFGMALADVESMIDEIGSIKTAEKLNVSRATLFRKLKKARESEDKIVR